MAVGIPPPPLIAFCTPTADVVEGTDGFNFRSRFCSINKRFDGDDDDATTTTGGGGDGMGNNVVVGASIVI
jgi:hypothetical protein